MVNVTSDKCYENREWEWGYREDEPMGGHDPYSSSKGAAELVTAAFRRSFFSDPDGTRLASARAGNVIGGGDWGEDRLVPDIMRAALAGETVRIRNPNSIRPWQHVINPLSGYLVLAQAAWEAPEHAAGWNFGPPDEDARPVGAIVERLGALWPGGAAARRSTTASTRTRPATSSSTPRARGCGSAGGRCSGSTRRSRRPSRGTGSCTTARDMRAVTLAQIQALGEQGGDAGGIVKALTAYTMLTDLRDKYFTPCRRLLLRVLRSAQPHRPADPGRPARSRSRSARTCSSELGPGWSPSSPVRACGSETARACPDTACSPPQSR